MRTPMRFAILAIVALLFSGSLYAQTAKPSTSSASLGVSLQQMVPRSDFRENTRGADRGHQGALGFNLIGHVNSFVALRLDYFFGTYSKNPCGGYCDNYSFRAGGIGSELVLPHGPVRPYLAAAVGRISLSSFDEADGSKADTGAGYWMYGAGVRVPAGRKGYVDLAWRHHDAGPVSYQYAQRNPDGSTVQSSARTRIPFDMFTLGFQWGFGGS
jgi:hypothetical protein